MVTKDTRVCGSISVSPGNFGTNALNYLFCKHDQNYLYKSFGIPEGWARQAILGARALGYAGLSVSNPYKGIAYEFCKGSGSAIGPVEKLTRVMNTIAFDARKVAGFNTDVEAFVSAYGNDIQPDMRVLVIGMGATSSSVCYALRHCLGVRDVCVTNRTARDRLNPVHTSCTIVPWEKAKYDMSADLLISTVPVPSIGSEFYVGDLLPDAFYDRISKRNVIIDVCRDTHLVNMASLSGNSIIVHDGTRMAAWNALQQFEIYTGCYLEDRELAVQEIVEVAA